MGKYRLYPDKSNTIIENSTINTGKNEVMELWYGKGGISRHLIHFDFSPYTQKYIAGQVPHLTATTSTFNMTNCYPIFERHPYADSYPAEASKIDIKVVQQFWNSGTGYDFYGKDIVRGNSNWYSATSTEYWALNGGDFLYTIFSGIVENSNDNLSFDVTDEAELWNVFTGDNYGFIIKFNDDFEALSGSNKHILKYYTNNSKTKYKMPYIDVTWDDQIKDCRNEIFAGSTNRLYLYVQKNGTFTDVYNISSVTISFSTGDTITSSTINNPMKGIYFVEFDYPSNGNSGNTFTDTWAVKLESGSTYTNIIQTGITVQQSDVWKSSINLESQKYFIETPNILNEYKIGDTIYLQINCIIPYTNTKKVLKNMEYKIDIIDGNINVPFLDWEPVSYTTNENFIIFDTSWFHKNYKYKISIRYEINGNIFSDSIEKKFWVR